MTPIEEAEAAVRRQLNEELVGQLARIRSLTPQQTAALLHRVWAQVPAGARAVALAAVTR